jgi:small ligand-binding sensory domain FIST
MPCGAALSRERASAAAAHEAVSMACQRAGGPVSTVILFASGEHHDAPALAAAARDAAAGAHVLGAVSTGIVGESSEVEGGHGVSALAFGSGGPEARPIWLGGALPPERDEGVLIYLGDGSGGPRAIASSGDPWVVGALAVAGTAGAALPRFIDESIAMSKPAGLLLGRRGEVVLGQAQGCRPVGDRLTVTASRGNVIELLDGRSAFEAFAERARPLLDDLPRAAQSVFLAIDEADDWVVRGIIAFDPDKGLLAATAPMPVGTRLRFALRDAAAGRDNLRRMLDGVKARLAGRTPRVALWFASAGRGRALFGVHDHDVAFIQDAIGPVPLAGLIGGSEIFAGRLHVFSGVLVVA